MEKVDKATTFKERVADFINKSKDRISQDATSIIYKIIVSYRQGKMPQEESIQTCRDFLTYMSKKMISEDYKFEFNHGELVKDLVEFEEGISVKRIHYKISLADLLKGLSILRLVLWSTLKREFYEEVLKAEIFFEIEKKINIIFESFSDTLTQSYLKCQEEALDSQERAFRKWEEVVKSAHNIELNIPCREEFAAIARLQAEALARRLKYDEEQVQDIKVAVGEACSNAIEHGQSRRGVDIHYHLSMENLVVEVRDYGSGFDPTGKGALPEDPLDERGRGLFLMKKLMDNVEIESKFGGGTLIILTKKREFK